MLPEPWGNSVVSFNVVPSHSGGYGYSNVETSGSSGYGGEENYDTAEYRSVGRRPIDYYYYII